MSTELRSALRDAVADEPTFLVDPRVIAHAGTRRIRRRTGIAVGTTALATVAVLVATSVVSRPAKPHPDPAPAEEVVRLDLGDAVAVEPEVVARTRTTWRDAGMNSLEYDRLEGITPDGLVLRSRYTNARGITELGLLDPLTGTTDWLPALPGKPGEIAGVHLDADRLVVISRTGIYQYTASVLDRGSRSWQTSIVSLPSGTEGHVTPRALLSPDDRLYLGSTMEGESGPMHWWSAPVVGGGDLRPEPALDGAAVAWGSDGTRATADTDGHVVLSSPQGDRVVGERRPDGCDRPSGFPDVPVRVVLAGDRPVVTYFCDSGEADVGVPLTVIYEPGAQIHVEGVTALASDQRHVLLGGGAPGIPVATAHPGDGWVYLVDLDRNTLSRLGRGVQESQVDVEAGMVLWNSTGSLDDNSVYDVTWTTARIE